MQDYPEAKRILLDINYRSNAHIVKGALRVIGHNKDRYEKENPAISGSAGDCACAGDTGSA